MIPDFARTILNLTMLDNTNREQITINENIENNLGSAITKNELTTISTTILITTIVLLILLYLGYRLNKYCKAYVIKHTNRIRANTAQNA